MRAGELRLVGVKDPEALGRVSVRNDAAFLFSVVATTSVAAVVLGQLPGGCARGPARAGLGVGYAFHRWNRGREVSAGAAVGRCEAA